MATARTRSPAVTMPARLSGSAAPSVRSRPVGAVRRTSRRRSTASGSANCSPDMPVNESPAADFAAGFETPVDASQLAPGRGVGFARQHAAEHDTVAAQQRPGLDSSTRRCRGPSASPAPSRSSIRPRAGAMRDHRPAPLVACRWFQNRAKAGEAIRRDQPAATRSAIAARSSSSLQACCRPQVRGRTSAAGAKKLASRPWQAGLR